MARRELDRRCRESEEEWVGELHGDDSSKIEAEERRKKRPEE